MGRAPDVVAPVIPVPPPFEVQQRAWECAHVLRADFTDRLFLCERVQVEEVYRTGPERLGWQDVQAMLRLAHRCLQVQA